MLEASENKDLLIAERENLKTVVSETENHRQLHVNSFESQGRLLKIFISFVVVFLPYVWSATLKS